MSLQKAGGIASFLNAVLAVAQLIIGVAVIGPAAMDIDLMAEMARTNPGPFIAQEVLKLVTAIVIVVVSLALYRRSGSEASTLNRLAFAAALISAVFLAAGGLIGLLALTTSVPLFDGSYATITQVVNQLGIISIAVGGLWLLLASWQSLKGDHLPRALCYIGFAYGTLSLVTYLVNPVALLALLVGLVWSVWLGLTLLRGYPGAV